MALTVSQYVDKVYYAFSHGQPQSTAGVISAAIEADLPRALQRLANTTAANPSLAHLLQKVHSITLTAGLGTLPTTLLTSQTAQERYFAQLAGVTNPLQRLWSEEDLSSPPSFLDYQYYALTRGRIKVVTSTGAATSGTALSLTGAFVPLISEVPDELQDDLIDAGVFLITEATQPELAAQSAQTT